MFAGGERTCTHMRKRTIPYNRTESRAASVLQQKPQLSTCRLGCKLRSGYESNNVTCNGAKTEEAGRTRSGIDSSAYQPQPSCWAVGA